MNTYRAGIREDYDEILPINPLPNEEEVLSLYPAIDTAIVKCTKVITNHSMPTAENPSKKKVEYNSWIDENWTMIGVANFYRRDYEGAIKNFEYVRKFFGKDPSNYKAALWQAKAYIQTKQYNKAGTILEELTKVAEEQQSASSQKGISSLLNKDADEKGKKKKKVSDLNPGQSVYDLVTKMNKYVLPPKMDFLKFDNISFFPLNTGVTNSIDLYLQFSTNTEASSLKIK
jgi:tetratricopeptide (TPR) repeat protein